jgi:hypothetical protein
LLDLAETRPGAVATRVFHDPATTPRPTSSRRPTGPPLRPSWAATTSAHRASRAASSGPSPPARPGRC